jgi:lysyl-tRNA synthetase class 2
LRIAPELYLKRLIVGGMPLIYEIGKNYRNEGVDATHNPEFTSMEFYAAYTSYEYLMDFIKRMISEYLVPEITKSVDGIVSFGEQKIDFNEWREISFQNALIQIGNVPENILNSEESIYTFLKEKGVEVKPGLGLGKLWEELFDEFVEAKLINPTFITEYPTSISPLARRSEDNPEVTERFELFIAGREIANGFNELNDPVDQYERFKAQVEAKDSDDESMHMDQDFIEALMYGMPPTAGAGIGIDRLVMLLANKTSIRDVIAFPAMK